MNKWRTFEIIQYDFLSIDFGYGDMRISCAKYSMHVISKLCKNNLMKEKDLYKQDQRPRHL